MLDSYLVWGAVVEEKTVENDLLPVRQEVIWEGSPGYEKVNYLGSSLPPFSKLIEKTDR
jgi:hypothetical protein